MNHAMQGVDITQAIRTRRTIKPEKMNGRIIPEDIIVDLLSQADWAPTHGRTEPWRFVVIAPGRVKEFATRHAGLYKQHTDPTSFTPEKFNKLVMLGENTSHIIMAWMKRVPNHKVPAIEEIAATSAAIQNILLTATAHGIASFWSTGGLTHHPAMKEEFKLGEEDIILGFIYLGYSDEPFKEGSRMIPLSEKIEWIR
ncbi:MAG: nitroreductase [Chitinophagaceae bacterium]|nr:nitroreductase [Chitinophagaceae bacterium]